MLILLTLLTGIASAGGGPWTLNPREHNVYVGFDHFRYETYRGSTSTQRTVASPIAATAVGGSWTIGLANDLEFEVRAPIEFVRVTDPNAEGCITDRPEDFCETSLNVGDLYGAVKWRFVDELYRSPVSMALVMSMRSGEFYAPERGRLTSLGDGTTDIGLGLSIGKTASVGRGWYTASADVRYHYRFPNTGGFFGEKVPTDELEFSAEGLWAFHPRFAVGPAVFGFTRMGGADFDDIDFFDEDGFASLAGTQLKAGAKLAIFGTDGGPTVSFTVARTFYARNNPTDTLSVSAGIGWFFPRKVRLLDQ